jgi:hypothetical protein
MLQGGWRFMLVAQCHTSCWHLLVLTAATASYLPTLHTLRKLFLEGDNALRMSAKRLGQTLRMPMPHLCRQNRGPRADDDMADGENAHHYMFCLIGLTYAM